ncbi:MAG: PQQ-dependent sugar dehydrogenase [Kangiellaceae bacterium]|nr:PQQ-dependent sugar dehydrogenase [Kangiellaceae bacterium]
MWNNNKLNDFGSVLLTSLSGLLITVLLVAMSACGGSNGGGGGPEPTNDTTDPVITLLGDNPMEIDYASVYVEPGATATDNQDGTVVVDISGAETIDSSRIESFTVEYQASDAAGNSTTITRTVNVVPARIANNSCLPPAPIGGNPGDVTIEASFPTLPILSSPLAMVQPSSDSSFWFVALREGRIVIFDNNVSANNLTEVLDISSRVSTTVEKGLTGLVVHPSYPQDNRIFIIYNDSSNDGRSTISSFTTNTSTHQVDERSENVLITLEQPAHNHNGGDIAFGPDGLLYAAFGDGGFDRDTSQQLYNLHGGMIRIDVSTQPYSIPNDNPFNSNQPRCDTGSRVQNDETSCPEIFAFGFRNPWRWSFDSQTGDIWVADVGQSTFEEVDRVVLGGNYGWPIMEGNSCFGGQACDISGLELPITQYPRSVGVSTVGGYVYRGTRNPSLVGQYIWGDTFSSQFLSVPADATVGADYQAIFNSGRLIAGMAEGNDGEIYLLNLDGGEGDGIYRINVEDDGSGVVVLPDSLSEVGCFNTQSKSSESGVFDYQLNSKLWSDGAAKTRSFAIPDNQLINLNDDGDFDFPENTILMKHFLNGDIYLETRLLINLPEGWMGYSYEWNDQQTEASLLSIGKIKDVGDFVHTFPSSNECDICHTSAANFSLGIETAQLNLQTERLGINQIDFLSDAGYFSQSTTAAEEPQLYDLDDTSATLEQRARSYLHSNCSGCHRQGTASDFIDLRYDRSFTQTETCDVVPSVSDLGIADARIIAPGNADASVLLLRMELLGQDRMPPLASLMIDQSATSLIRDWINGLTGCE